LFPSLGQGQWPLEAITKMIQSGRQLTQYNFILPIIDSLQDSIMKIPIEPSFLALDESVKQVVNFAQHMMYADRELMGWDITFRKLVLYGLIFEGVIKLTVSDQYDELGNIGFEICPQGSVFFDPFWKSGMRKDLKKVYKKTWMTAEEIARTYKLERAEIEARMTELTGEEYGTFTGVNPYDVASNRWGTLHQIFEEYYMAPVVKEQEVIDGPDGEFDMPDIPDEDKSAFMDEFMPEGWDKNNVRVEETNIEECFLKTAIPTISGEKLVVKDKRTEEQVGSPPFYVWAANRENGQSRGSVDSMKDAQTNQNFIEAEILRKIQAEGGGGSKFVDKSMFLPGEYQKFLKYSSRPDMKFGVKPGAFKKGGTPSIPVETTGVPSAMYENIKHIQQDIIPSISKRPPTTMGRGDQKNPNMGEGLFRLMETEAESQIGSMVVSYRQFMNEVFEGYFLQSGQTYTNEMVPRDFTYQDKTMIANEPVGMSGGGMVVKNDLRALLKMRHKVLINEKLASPTAKANTADRLVAFSKIVPQENIGTRTVVNHEIAKNMEQISDESQAELKEMAGLELDVAKSKLKLEKANIELQTVQIQSQLQQLTPEPAAPEAPTGPSYELPPQTGEEPVDAEVVEGKPTPSEGETINQGAPV